MDDGRTVQDRVEEAERKIQILLNEVAKSDQTNAKLDNYANITIGIATDLTAAQKKIKELDLNLSALAGSHNQLSESLNRVEDFSKKTDADLVMAITMASSSDREIINKLSENTKQSLESLSLKINSKADKPEMEALSDYIKSSINQYTSAFSDQINQFANRFSVFTDMITQQISKYVCSEDMSLMEAAILGFVKTENGLFKDALKEMKNSLDEKFSQFEEKISLNCQKKDENLPNFEQVRQEFDKKMQNVLLDAQNATLRTQNSDQKITTLERRIENLDLRLKKSELQE